MRRVEAPGVAAPCSQTMEHIHSEADSLDWLIFETFGDLEDLVKEISSYLSDSADRRRVHAEAYYGYSSDALLQELEEIDRQVGQEFPRAFTYSLVMLAYSQFEFFLNEIGNLLCKTLALPVGISSFKGSLVERAGLFFSVFSLYGWSVAERRELIDFTLVRNCIAHNAGLIKGAQRERALRAIIRKTEGLEISKWHSLIVSLDYCRTEIGFINRMLRRVVFANFYPEEASTKGPQADA